MKTLLSSTALVLAFGLPGIVASQTSPPEKGTMAEGESKQAASARNMPGFLDTHEETDLFASDLMGQDVYMRQSGAAEMETDPQGDETTGATDTDAAEPEMTDGGMTDRGTSAGSATGGMTSMSSSDLDNMETIGQINEIVLSEDGQVRALVIGVGGFLGMGEQDVAVTLDDVTFAPGADDPMQRHVILATDGEMLKEAPAFERMSAQGTDTDPATSGVIGMDRNNDDESTSENMADMDGQVGNTQATDTGNGLMAPDVKREGYDRVDGNEVSAEMLMGKTVYDAGDSDVGTVTDLVINDGGEGTDVIIDFGGFLGIGSSQVAIAYSELTFLLGGSEDVRLYVDATEEQIRNMPQYAPAD